MVGLVSGTVGLATVWLIFQHKPVWYKPPPVDDRMLRETRSEVAQIVEGISQRIVRGETFDLSFTDETVNQWLAALPHVWPDARQKVPPEFRDMVVRFDEGRIRVASLLVKGGWRVVLTVVIDVALSKDGRQISLELVEVRGGSLNVPRPILVRVLDGVAIGDAGVTDWLKGRQVPNRFVWPNGRRPFRIDAIELTEGRIRLRLESL